MATTVGTESTYSDLIASLVELEHDAIAAYDSCIERLDDVAAKAKVDEFKQDHLRHLEELRRLATADGIDIPSEGGMKQYLTTGKVGLASIMGDSAILKAMASNENDTVAAYERASEHADAPETVRQTFERARQDEVRHRTWMESASKAA